MSKKILLTGITGMIGSSVLERIIELGNEFSVTAIVRPGTNLSRIKYQDKIAIEYLDLSDSTSLNVLLSQHVFEMIIHIGALRGGRKASKKDFYNTNVRSTDQLVEHSLKHKSRFIFCSSVGVFGAIPDEIPANNETPYKADNYYHFTKIQAEKLINKAILHGLDAVILRPSIVYGPGDNGFPYQLVKLVKNRMFLLSNKNVWMHLCNIDVITTAIINLCTSKTHITGLTYNIADIDPIQLRDLVNFIYRQLYNKNYPKLLSIDSAFLNAGATIARFMRNELWTSRFELISNSWFYKVFDAYESLDLPSHYTNPDFKIVITDYLNRL